MSRMTTAMPVAKVTIVIEMRDGTRKEIALGPVDDKGPDSLTFDFELDRPPVDDHEAMARAGGGYWIRKPGPITSITLRASGKLL